MDTLQKTFYVGSCRYQPLFKKIFPPRLHTTSEIINFLKNYKTIDLNQVDANQVWGDIVHPAIAPQSKAFMDSVDEAFDNINGVVLEVSTRRVYMDNETPLNAFYVDYYRACKDSYKLIVLTDDELHRDLKFIKNHIQNVYGIDKLAVIPHVNLPLKDGSTISERVSLCRVLETICTDLDIVYIDLAKIYCLNTNTTLYLDDILPNQIHYDTDKQIELIVKHLQHLGWE